jgi:peptidoglycan/xylan/chitin deacetylase (PgdA/CDA1 family)
MVPVRISRLVRRTAALVLGLALRFSRRRAGLVLVYHGLAERSGDPARELVPAHAVTLFEAHVRLLRSRYRIVPADQLPAAVAARRRGNRFPVAITFDDDLASHVELAAPVLGRLGAPATFFLTGATLELPVSFWWEQLQRTVDLGRDVPVEGEGIHERAERIERMSAAERDAVVARLDDGDGEPGLRATQVRALADARFALGFHTLRHERLTELADDALDDALVEGRAELEAVSGRQLDSIAYPHGKADVRVARAAKAAGYRLGFTGRYEPVLATTDPLLLGRVEPSFGPLEDFALQLVGVLRRQPHR